jgi:hypothetical protein
LNLLSIILWGLSNLGKATKKQLMTNNNTMKGSKCVEDLKYLEG